MSCVPLSWLVIWINYLRYTYKADQGCVWIADFQRKFATFFNYILTSYTFSLIFLQKVQKNAIQISQEKIQREAMVQYPPHFFFSRVSIIVYTLSLLGCFWWDRCMRCGPNCLPDPWPLYYYYCIIIVRWSTTKE